MIILVCKIIRILQTNKLHHHTSYLRYLSLLCIKLSTMHDAIHTASRPHTEFRSFLRVLVGIICALSMWCIGASTECCRNNIHAYHIHH